MADSKSLFLGLDISNLTKVVLIDGTGSVDSSSAHSYETPCPQWSEEYLDLGWHGAVKSLWQVCAAMSRTVSHNPIGG